MGNGYNTGGNAEGHRSEPVQSIHQYVDLLDIRSLGVEDGLSVLRTMNISLEARTGRRNVRVSTPEPVVSERRERK